MDREVAWLMSFFGVAKSCKIHAILMITSFVTEKLVFLKRVTQVVAMIRTWKASVGHGLRLSASELIKITSYVVKIGILITL